MWHALKIGTLLLATAYALGQSENWIFEHNPNLELGDDYVIANNVITILRVTPGETFQFEAREYVADQDVGPGFINGITYGGTQALALTIVGHDGHVHGAEDVGYIYLAQPNISNCRVLAMTISGTFGGLGSSRARTWGTCIVGTLAGDITCDTIGDFTATEAGPHTGDITVNGPYAGMMSIAGDSSGAITINGPVTGAVGISGDANTVKWDDGLTGHTADLIVGGDITSFIADGSVYGDVQIGGTAGLVRITSGSLRGDISVEGSVFSLDILTGAVETGASVSLRGDCDFLNVGMGQESTIDVAGSIIGATFGGSLHGAFTGDLTVGGTLSTLTLTGPLFGDITVASDGVGTASFKDLNGSFVIDGNCSDAASFSVDGDLNGRITVTGDFAGTIDVSGEMNDLYGDTGQITVDGAFGAGASIVVDGGFASTTEFIAINHDGVNDGEYLDLWGDGATVTVGQFTYDRDTPAARVRHVSNVKGDVNNDGDFDGADMDPWFAALSDGGAAYLAANRGMEASFLFHFDMNCDGYFDGNDIDPFFATLGGGDPCGYQPLTPERVADLILTYVDSHRVSFVVGVIEDRVLVHEAEPERAAFWNEVVDLLTRQ